MRNHHDTTNGGATPVTITSSAGGETHLLPNPSRAERSMLDKMGGPWLAPDPSGAALEAAGARFNRAKIALGQQPGIGRWLTTDTSKFNKSVASGRVDQLAGVTLLAAREAAEVWMALEAHQRHGLAAALEVTEDAIAAVLRMTVCPHATPLCTLGCVTTRTVNAERHRTRESRLIKNLMTLMHPAETFELTHYQLNRLAVRYGPDKVRWRINISDDLRYESLAPGLLDIGIAGYAYTKHPASDRPEREGVRVVYSVTERWDEATIVKTCAAGHTVAVVFDLRRSQALPTTWLGLPVVDGDATDDLWEHPQGAVVGLRLKGRRTITKDRLRHGGFARSVGIVSADD